MTYKFETESGNLEVKCWNDSELQLGIITPENEETIIYLDKKDIYHLIGALHQIQKEIK
jgi:hypothetical protein